VADLTGVVGKVIKVEAFCIDPRLLRIP